MISLVLSFFLALFASWFVLTPVLEGTQSKDSDSSLDLELEKERLFFRLEELEQDKILERISERGFEVSRAEIVSELSLCLDKLGLDKLSPTEIERKK